jgi:7,8-dihydropterin-6-yl-methyl-4-(beta-D-ribofuranosyl)aminobenzene 5'-phosphate synthase
VTLTGQRRVAPTLSSLNPGRKGIKEQALLARVKDKGLVIVTGCGHPTIEVILEMVRQLSDQPLYAIAGGLHFPITGSRGAILGIQPQAILGTGKPPWQRVNDQDLSRTIAAINDAAPAKVYLSGHDTCDHAIARMQSELAADSEVLQAGATYRL